MSRHVVVTRPRPFFVPALIACLALALAAGAQEAPADAPMSEEQLRAAAAAYEAELGYEHGTIDIGDGMATLEVPAGFRYIGPDAAKRVLEDVWGNPPGSGDGVLGMIFPADLGPFDEAGWGVVITYDDDGHVDDDDAADIDYADLLKDMKKGSAAANEERKKQGFPAVELVGWAETPSYDSASKKLYWAKELAFEGAPTHTLNYNVRVLGRKGVLVLNAVADMEALPTIRMSMREVLGFVDFNAGNRYADFNDDTDKVATYGVAGLVAGGLATKAGLFKGILAALLAAKKLLVVGAVAAIAVIKKLFFGKSA